MGFEPPAGGARWARWPLLAAAALALALGARSLLSSAPGALNAGQARVEAAAPPAKHPPERPARPAVTQGPAPPAEPALSPLPGSLRGTAEDGALRVDERGELIVGPGVIAFFNYYLSATGEESAAAIKARIVRRIRERLQGKAADRALDLLDRYLAFRDASRGLRAGEDSDLGARLEAIRALRRAHFAGEDADALFGTQESTDAVTVAQQDLARDGALSPEERARRVAELDQALPEPERAAREASSRPLRQREEEEAMRAAGASAEEIQRHRVATVGEAAAERLGALDQARAAWAQRLSAYRAERAAIERRTEDPAARAAAIEALLAASFTKEERLRVKALDSIAAGSASP